MNAQMRGRINSYVFVLKNIYGEAKPRVQPYQTVRIWDLATTRMQTMHGCLCNEAKQRKKVKHFRMTFLRFKIQFYLFHTWRLPIPVRRLQNLTTLKFLKVLSFNIFLELEHLSKWFCAAKLKGSDGGDGALLNYALARDYLCWASTSTKHSSLILGRTTKYLNHPCFRNSNVIKKLIFVFVVAASWDFFTF